MEAMGQMGNSDEATMRDDLPFDINDLDMEDEVEYNRGGVVKAANGMYIAPTVPAQYKNESIETTNPMAMQQIQSGFAPSQYTTNPYSGNPQNMYNPQGTPYAPANYRDLLGASADGAPTTESVRYFNEATGQTRMIPHIVNADGTRGNTLYPIPEGFVIQEEAPKEEVKKTQVQSTKVAPVESGDDGGGGSTTSATDPAGDPLSYSGLFSFDALDKQMAKVGAMQFSTLGKAGIAQGLGSAATGNPERNQMKLGAITPLFTSLKEKLGLKGQNLGNLKNKTPEEIAKIRGVIAADIERVSAAVDRLTTNITFSKDKNGNTVSEETNKSTKDTIDDVNAMAEKYGLTEISTKSNVNLSSKIGQKIAEINQAIQDKPTTQMDRGPTIAEYEQGLDNTSPSSTNTGQSDAAGNAPQDDNPGDNDSSNDDTTSTAEDFNTGGLAGKKKPKPKKMKRGGLASR